MADFRYFNGFSPQLTKASQYEINGQRIIEVWTKFVELKTCRERKEDFKNPTEHVLSVELDVVNGKPKIIFFYDDKPTNLLPVLTLPSNAELVKMLTELIG